MNPEQKAITGNKKKSNLSSEQKALSEFYEAFNSRDLVKMSNNWAHSDEIAMDNPLGSIKRGWEEIKSAYEKIFNGRAKVYVEFYDYTIHKGSDIFYAVGRERG